VEMTELECKTFAEEHGAGFISGSWAPNASDGTPAPDHCYMKPQNGHMFFNRRSSVQEATKIRSKVCLCSPDASTETTITATSLTSVTSTTTVTSSTTLSSNTAASTMRQIDRGSCHSVDCMELTESECEAFAAHNGAGFIRGSWAPNAADGTPAPDHCYVKPENGYTLFNRRNSTQEATDTRNKVCLCASQGSTVTLSSTTTLTTMTATTIIRRGVGPI